MRSNWVRSNGGMLILLAVAAAGSSPLANAQQEDPPQASNPQADARPWLGFLGDDDGRQIGVRIETVRPKSPAADSGLRQGDVVTSAAGLPIRTLRDLVMLVRQLKAGQNIEVEFVRDGKRQQTMLRLVARPESLAPAGRPYLGVLVVPGPDGRGAVVDRVEAGGPAHAAGLRPGQRIVSLDGLEIGSPEDMLEFMRPVRPGQVLRVQVADGGPDLRSLQLRVGADPEPKPSSESAAAPAVGTPTPAPPSDPAEAPNDREAQALEEQIEMLEAELARLKARLRTLREGDGSNGPR